MKLTVLLMTISILNVSAKGLSQSITFSGKDVPLDVVFTQVEKQTGYFFLYSDAVIARAKRVTIDVSNASVEDFLQKIFTHQPLTYSIREKNVFVDVMATRSPTLALGMPPIDVKGKVVNEKGEPLAGVTVRIKEATDQTSTQTDAQGFFQLRADVGNTLVITYVGFQERQVKITTADLIAVTLLLTNTPLDTAEVIVSTGYQTVPRERATGAFTQVNKQLFNQQVSTDVLSRLQFVASGLTTMPKNLPVQGKGIMIRGLSTLGGSRDPLIVLDNFPYQGNINNINPNDVESVTILKDAAAASIWGAQAGNGVIVITTKKGHYNEPVSIDVNANVLFTEPADLFSTDIMSPSDFIDVENLAFDSGYYDFRLGYPDYYSLTPVISIRHKERQGLLTPGEATAQIDALRSRDVRSEYKKHFYRTGVNQQYSLSLSGGTAIHAWSIFGGLDNNNSDLADRYKRYNFHFTNQLKVARNLEFASNIFYARSDNTVGRPVYGNLNPRKLPPYTRFAADDGTALPLYTYLSHFREGFVDTLGGGKLLDWKYYPLQDYKHVSNTNDLQDINAELRLKYTIVAGLSVGVQYRYQHQQSADRLHYGVESFFARDMINRFSQLDYASGRVTYIVPKGGILEVRQSAVTGQDFRGQINFNKQWGRHGVSAIAGGQATELLTEGSTQTTYGYIEDVYTTGLIDPTHAYPQFYFGYDDVIPNPVDFTRTNNRFVAVYTNATYAYDDRYMVSGSVRRDAYNFFGLNTNDKWRPLWSFGAGWTISNEAFYRSGALPFLKIRATYGANGNVDPRRVAQTTIRYQNNNQFTGLPVARVDNFYNPDLTWEQVGMLNIAVDFSTKNSRISGSVEVYEKTCSDLISSAPIDVTTGLGNSFINRNVASMRGRGVEMTINTINTTGVVQWSSMLLVNHYHDKAVTGRAKTSIKAESVVGGAGASGIEDYSSYALFAYKWAGLDPLTGDPRGYLNGEVSSDYANILSGTTQIDDLVHVGRLLPILSGNFGNTVRFKKLSLTALFQYKFGYYFKRSGIRYEELQTSYGHQDYASRWKKPGDEQFTDIPSYQYTVATGRDQFYLFSEALAERGDHIRLQYVTLDYTIDGRTLKMKGVKQIQLYATANNLGVLWKANRKGIDPDFQLMRPSRTYAMGIRIGL